MTAGSPVAVVIAAAPSGRCFLSSVISSEFCSFSASMIGDHSCTRRVGSAFASRSTFARSMRPWWHATQSAVIELESIWSTAAPFSSSSRTMSRAPSWHAL